MINQTVLWFAVISVIDGYTQVQLFDNVIAFRPYLYPSWALLLHPRFLLPYCMVRRQDLHNRETNWDHYSYLLPCMSQQWLSTHHQYHTVSWLAVAFLNFQWFLSWLLRKWSGKLSVAYQLEFRRTTCRLNAQVVTKTWTWLLWCWTSWKHAWCLHSSWQHRVLQILTDLWPAMTCILSSTWL